jgi:hypothetical protein
MRGDMVFQPVSHLSEPEIIGYSENRLGEYGELIPLYIPLLAHKIYGIYIVSSGHIVHRK